MMTHEQVDEIENKLRQAQKLVEECGAEICDERAANAPELWNRLTCLSADIGYVVGRLWPLRP